MYKEWEIICKKDLDIGSLKCTIGKTYRIKDKFPCGIESRETWYEIVGDIGMTAISHKTLCEYFETE